MKDLRDRPMLIDRKQAKFIRRFALGWAVFIAACCLLHLYQLSQTYLIIVN